MIRFPLARFQCGATASTVCAPLCFSSRSFTSRTRLNFQPPPTQHPPPSRGLGEIDEDRVARWCRRLWDVTRTSSDTATAGPLLPRLNPLHEAQLRRMDADEKTGNAGVVAAAAAGATTPASAAGSSATTPTRTASAAASSQIQRTSAPYCASEAESLEVDALLARLQRAIRGDGGRIPGVIVEDVWTVFDLLVPPSTQDDVSPATITPAVEENFFAFVSTLNEVDFDLQAVVQASKELSGKVKDYLALLRQMESKEEQLTTAWHATNAVKCAAEAGAFAAEVMKAKGEVMRCCFQARNVGAPLYYTWLRHTASLADGLRRLMHFRKLAHYFETLCKKRIRACDAQLRSAADATTAEDVARQQFKWRSRQIEVGLIDGALSLLFHDFFAKEYLVMEELTWYTTPPSLLDQIMRAESVHPFERGLDDMRYRLQPAHHRHLFAFLHPAVVEEPLIAVQVALTHGIACSVDRILGRPTPLADPANTTKAAELFRQLTAADQASPPPLPTPHSESAAVAAVAGGVAVHSNSSSHSSTAAAKIDGDVNTAIFYSINSAQSALRGMDMGNRLIKRVVKEVEGNINASRKGHNLTPIHTFSTLSPIPLYVKWLAGEAAALKAQLTATTPASSAARTDAPTGVFGKHLTTAEEEALYWAPLREAVAGYVLRHPSLLAQEAQAVTQSAAAAAETSASQPAPQRYAAANAAVLQYLLRLFQTAPADATGGGCVRWWSDHAFTAALEGPLLRSVAVYLATVKRQGSTRIRDPVGNFHVSNGATVYRLNFLGNTTEQGSRESACVMVNYWYDLPTVSGNVTAYEVSQQVALGEPVKALLGAEVQ